MTSPKECETCGAPVVPGALCPRCLLAVGEGRDPSDDEILNGLIGETIDGKYCVERLLGEGGMGAVYLATHVGTERPVALKVLAPRLMDDEEFVERFRREARAAGRLRHPNIVNVTDFGIADFRHEGAIAYLVMEVLDGQSLAEYIAKGYERPLPWVADVVEQIALAVDEAHRNGVIHRDLKPGNIWLVPNGRGEHIVKVLDFGLAKLRGVDENGIAGEIAASSATTSIVPMSLEDATPTLALPSAPGQRRAQAFGGWKSAARMTRVASRDTLAGNPPSEAEGLTRYGSVLGTPHYMSPEQCRGERVDGRSDVYSLGVIAYEMITGRPPFTGDVDTLVSQHLSRTPSEPSLLRKRLPTCIDDVVLLALAKTPADRPVSASAFAASLRSALRTSVESPRSILTQAVTLYGNHLAVFFGLSPLTGIVTPVLGILLGLRAYDALPGALGWAALVAIVIAGWYIGSFLNATLLVPLVAQSLDRPAERLRVPPMLRKSLARIPTFAVVNLWPTRVGLAYGAFFATLAAIIGGAELRTNVAAWLYLLWGAAGALLRHSTLTSAIALLEASGPRATMRRAQTLKARLKEVYKNTYSASETFVSLLTALGVVLAWMAWGLVHAGSGEVLGPETRRIAIMFLSSSALTSLLLNPIVGIAHALQYLKARQLGGESVAELAGATESLASIEAMASSSYAWMRSFVDKPRFAPRMGCWQTFQLLLPLAFVLVAIGPIVRSGGSAWFMGPFLLVSLVFAARKLLPAATLAVSEERVSVAQLTGRHSIRWDDVVLARRVEKGVRVEARDGEAISIEADTYRNGEMLLEYVRHQLGRRSIAVS